MGKMKDGFFWGVLLGAAATALAGAVALARSFKSSGDGGASWEKPARGKKSPRQRRPPAGSKGKSR